MRAAAALFTFAVLSAHSMDIKGISVGMDVHEFKQRVPQLFCLPSKDDPRREACVATRKQNATFGVFDTYAGHRVDEAYVHLLLGKVRSISLRFSSVSYLPITTTLTEKYGQPSIETSVVQNRMGAKFDQEERTWSDGDDRILVRQRASNLTQMEVRLYSHAGLMSEVEDAKSKAKRAIGDL